MKPPALTRREVLKLAVGATGATIAAPMINLGRYRLFAWSKQEYSARCIDLVGGSLVIDMLSPLTINDRTEARWGPGLEGLTDVDAREFAGSGIDVFHAAVGIGGRTFDEARANTLEYVATLNAFIANRPDLLLRVDSGEDLDRVHGSGRVGVLIGTQNSSHFRSPDDVTLFHRLGQRVSQLTYNSRNLIGNGSTERVDGGISDFGLAIIERMNESGMAVDVSHCGDRTTLDAFEVSKRPVLITHSNCRALVPGHPRCKPDEAIRAMAASGGVVGITGVRMFVKPAEPTTIEDYLDHFDHVRELVGAEHLGVGSDMDLHGYDDLPAEQSAALRAGYKSSYGFREKIDIEGVDHPKRMFDLTEGLIRRGYADQAIRGILGGNFARVLKEIWSV
jgi:membrane dipeptidase